MFTKIRIDNYVLQKVLGKGKNSEIFLATKDQSHEKFVIKKYSREFNGKSNLYNEINILKKLNHPNIIKLEDLKKTRNSFYTIYEYCNGEKLSEILHYYMEFYNKKLLPEGIVQHLMNQIIYAFLYMERMKICYNEFRMENNVNYNNINLDNILINFDNEKNKEEINLMNATAKIINFKNAYTFTYENFQLDGELILSQHNKKRVDSIIFCLGKICYELIVGKTPFEANNDEELKTKIKKGDYYIPSGLSMEAIDFINNTLKYSEENRLQLYNLQKLDFLSKKIEDFHFCNFNHMKIFDKANINIQGIVVNMKNKEDKVLTKIIEMSEENEEESKNEIKNEKYELFSIENPFPNLKESVEQDINDEDYVYLAPNFKIKDSIMLYQKRNKK